MTQATLFGLSVTFALVTGTAAGVLGLLSWEVFHRSAFGRVILVLTVLLWVFTLYHALLLVYTEPVPAIELLRSVLYTGVAVFIALMLRMQLRVRAGMEGG